MIKEFVLKHPFISFLIVDTVVCHVLTFGNNILKTIMACKGVDSTTEETKETNVEVEEA